MNELPEADGWQYEPKWDGFRGVLENLDGTIHLWSRNERPLLRYFPELEALGERLPPRSAVDGEIVIETDGVLDFDKLQMRLHPAESRVAKLSAEIPATFVAFDVLLWDGEPVHELPLEERRARVEALPFSISPATRDLETAPDVARAPRGRRVRRRRREAARLALPARLARGRGEGEAGADGRLRRHRRHLEREGHGDREPDARALRRRGRASPRRLGLDRQAARRDRRARAARCSGRTRSAGRAASRAAGDRRCSSSGRRSRPSSSSRSSTTSGRARGSATGEVPALPAGQGAGGVHLRAATPEAAEGRPDRRGAPRLGAGRAAEEAGASEVRTAERSVARV